MRLGLNGPRFFIRGNKGDHICDGGFQFHILVGKFSHAIHFSNRKMSDPPVRNKMLEFSMYGNRYMRNRSATGFVKVMNELGYNCA